MDIFSLLEPLWKGFQMIGQALIGIIQAFLGLFHLTVPDYAVQLSTIVILVLAVLKFGKFIPKILLAVLLLMLASTMLQLLL